MAQDHYERGPTYPWFLLSEDSTIRTADGDRRVPLPTGYIAEYEEGGLYYDTEVTGADLVELSKDDFDYWNAFYGSSATGEPEAYSLDGLYFNIFPLPDDTYLLRTKVYLKDTDVSSISGDATNKWLTYAPNCIIGWAGQVLASGLRDNVAGAKFVSMESEGRKLLQIQNEERKVSNRSLQIGGPEA